MKKGLKYVLLAVCMMTLMSTTVFAANGTLGGSGTEAAPYLIEDLADLEAFRDAVNNGESYEGKTLALANTITLTGEWTPIGNGNRSGSTYTGNAFKGTFDGRGNTIFGLSINAGEASAAIGLFGVVDGGTVKNLTLSDVSINAADNKNAGAAIGLMVNNATADSIIVSGSVTAADGTGGVVGRMTISGTISNCTNSATVTGTGSGAGTGGIVGKAYYTGENKVMTISGCTNSGIVTSGYAAGGIVGLSAADVTDCTNTAAITAATEAGGIVGEQVNRGTVSGNNNSGAVSNNTTGGTAYGGIIGWIRYQTSTSDYPTAANEVITVSDNANSGTVSASGSSLGSGGIVGTIYNQANVTGNTNTAASVTGGVFAAGIVGGAQPANNNVVIPGATISATNNVTTTALSAISAINVSSDMYNNAPNSFVNSGNGESWVAETGETKYTTLQAAIDAATPDSVVKLLNSITLTEGVTVAADDKITLDLNGKTVSMDYTTAVSANHEMILNKGDLTIQDSSEGGGKLSYTYSGATTGNATNTITSEPGSKLTVKSGTIENLTFDSALIAYAIDGRTNGGAGDVTVSIEGGTITSERQAVRIFANSTTNVGTLNISGGDITGRVIVQNANQSANKAVLTITGGTFNVNAYKTDVLYVGGSNSAYIAMTAAVSGGTFKGSITDTHVTEFITGGTYSDTSAEAYLAPDYVLDSYVDSTGKTVYGVEPSVNVSFDAGEGTGTMATVTVPAGDYVLPASGFTAPEGKQFMAWNVNGVVKLAGATVSITADTTLVALWEDIGHTCVPTGWKNDKDSHWKWCDVVGCFEIIPGSQGAHADANADGYCDTCGYNVGKSVSPATGESSTAIVWLIVALGAAVCAGLLVTNKRSRV